MKSVMLDFETWSTDSNATIVQIGACYFDRNTGHVDLATGTLKCNVDAATSVATGSTLDPNTVYWWLKQSKEAVDSITANPKHSLIEAMGLLNGFLNGCDEIWSHATFDFVILQQTLKRLNIKPTYHYRVARDIRTLSSLAGSKKFDGKREGVHHDALADCLHQVKYVVEALNSIQVKK